MIFNEKNIFGKAVKVLYFGKPFDWKINSVKNQKRFLEKFFRKAETEKTKEIYAPNSSLFNRKIAEQVEFKKRLQYSKSNLLIQRGVYAEGLEIGKSQAAWFSVADCAIIVACHLPSGKTLTAHAGRDSLHPLSTKGKNKSIVYSIMEYFQKNNLSANEVSVFVIGGIGPKKFYHRWNDLKKGRRNKKIISYFKKEFGETAGWLYGREKDGRLNLFEIIKRQFILSGVLTEKIAKDKVDTFSDKNKDGFIWHSNRRGDKSRNGIMVVVKS